MDTSKETLNEKSNEPLIETKKETSNEPLIETQKEKPNYENNQFKINSEYVKRFIGKTCYISFAKCIVLPFITSNYVYQVKATIQNYDGYYLAVIIPYKQKHFSGIIAINNVSAIFLEETNN